MLQDLSAAVRSLRKSRAFTAVALAVLALGIGSGTAIFSIVDAVVLRSLPFDEPDRLVAVLEHDTKRPTTFGGGTTTSQMYLDWRRLQTSFEALAAVGGTSFRVRNEFDQPDTAYAQRVSWEFFPVLRVAPFMGRAFSPDDEIEGRHRVVILSYGCWQRRFAGAPDVVGKTITLDEASWEIIGVMPRGFSYPVAPAQRATEIYTPLWFRADEKIRRDDRNYSYLAIGRLKAGVTLSQASDQMNAVAAALDQQYPTWSPGRRVRLQTLHEYLVGRVRSWMLMLLGAVGFVLLIACANVANLMLARATDRRREIGIRAALGAGRWRIVRGLLVEALLLSLAGAVLGLLVAYAGVQVLRVWLPINVPRVAAISIDLRVLGAAAAAALVTGVLFGLAPALQSWRPDVVTSLKDGGRSATTGRAGQHLRDVLVVVEVALAVVLLVGAALFVGSFVRLMRVDTGFDYHNVLTLGVGVRFTPDDVEESFARARPYVEQMIEAVRRVPGVEMAGAVSGGLPLTGNWSRTAVKLPDRGDLKGEDDSIDRRIVSVDYLRVLRVPLLRGRLLNEQDNENAPAVVVINQAAAKKYWPGRDPIGERVTINGKERTVVGIVGDIRHLGPEMPPRQECYLPLAQDRLLGATLVMRTRGDPLAVLPAVKAAIWAVSPEQRLATDAVTLEAYMDRLIAQRRFNMALLAVFGLLGLVIAAVGIYGVMACVVAQRTSEIGVRMALGATRGRVVSMVIGRAAILLLAGLALGSATAWYVSAGIRTFLFQIEPGDLRVFVLALITLAAAGLAASAIPARRAATVDPVVALRAE